MYIFFVFKAEGKKEKNSLRSVIQNNKHVRQDGFGDMHVEGNDDDRQTETRDWGLAGVAMMRK